ncbi:hypothetical protein DOE78_19090 [Bacillus sp. Y1]|nr:replication protein [Bacillus sp. Y1]AYA77386.1 hypothetical protein DOE78_19090 [Bacillus sp. Y1]
MNWAGLTHERIVTIYSDLFDEVVINRRNKDLAIKEVMILAEVLKRDFSKRQLSILGLIMTFSYFYGKETALIPKLSDFELAGISKTKINVELSKLVELDIITWTRGRDANEYMINDPRQWKAEYHKKYNDIRSRELFFLNLKHAGISFNLDEIIAKAMADRK